MELGAQKPVSVIVQFRFISSGETPQGKAGAAYSFNFISFPDCRDGFTPAMAQSYVPSHAQTGGDGTMVLSSAHTPVLLIRGLLRESRHWLSFPLLLSEQLKRPVFTLDLPGCGLLNLQRSATSVPAMRAQLQQQWAEGYPQYQGQAVHLVAISMGGMLALDWALAAPEQVKSLVLMNSSSAGLNPFWQRLQPRNYLKVLLCLLAGPLKREELIWQMTVNSPLQPDILKQWQQWAIEQPVSRVNALRQLWAASRFRLTRQPDCPVTVVSGLADQLVSPRCSQALAEQLNAVLLTHAEAGHDLPLEAGPWLADVIDQNLNEVYRQYNYV